MRILIAEDDTTSRLILQETLGQLGHDVVAAANGEEAWAAWRRESVSLVISDWMMPDLDGIELCRRIRAENRARYTYVILLTALGGKENYLEAMRAGADDFASKPLDADQLHARLRVAERIRGLQRELVQMELSQQQIVQQERLRALGEMASGIAHDFSNALTAIVGFSDMMLTVPRELDDKSKVAQRLALIRTAGRDAADLVRRLREFSRPKDESDVSKPVDINDAIRTAVALSEPRWKAQARAAGGAVHLHTDLPDVPLIDGHASELRDVLINLIFNAVDAMPHGGTLRIATEHEGPRSAVLVTLADTGTGMPPEVRRRCFEPFFTTKGDRGTGLGLAMAYGIVQRHGATLDVESEPGEGTTFRIRFPALADLPASPGSTSVEVVSPPLRILVVENEPLPRQVVVEYLQGDGHKVETALDGRDGLQRVHDGGFDVVVTERAMPGMSGVQLAAAIEEVPGSRPAVILLSGFASGNGMSESLPPGVDCVLPKPVSLERLRAALGRLGRTGR
jgi:signal transduction histidine kinase